MRWSFFGALVAGMVGIALDRRKHVAIGCTVLAGAIVLLYLLVPLVVSLAGAAGAIRPSGGMT